MGLPRFQIMTLKTAKRKIKCMYMYWCLVCNKWRIIWFVKIEKSRNALHQCIENCQKICLFPCWFFDDIWPYFVYMCLVWCSWRRGSSSMPTSVSQASSESSTWVRALPLRHSMPTSARQLHPTSSPMWEHLEKLTGWSQQIVICVNKDFERSEPVKCRSTIF